MDRYFGWGFGSGCCGFAIGISGAEWLGNSELDAEKLGVAKQLGPLSSGRTEYSTGVVTIIVCRTEYSTGVRTAQQLGVTR